MSSVNTVLKVAILYLAELVSSVSDWFQTKPEWANKDILENAELKTTGGSELQTNKKLSTVVCFMHTVTSTALCFSVHERQKAKTLWERTGAVIMVVRRPG